MYMNRSELEKAANSSQLIRSKRIETVRVIKNLERNTISAWPTPAFAFNLTSS